VSSSTSEWSLEQLERRWPAIAWREPIHVERTDGAEGWACRVCIANVGLMARDIDKLWRSPDEVREHLALCHAPASSTGVKRS
jgi:hypothetical protein